MESLRNKWKTEREKEEIKSEQIWQANEAKIKSKIPPDSMMEKLDKENLISTKTVPRQMAVKEHPRKE